MQLSEFDQKYVCIKTVYGDTIIGLARYCDAEYLQSEWGGDEEGLFVEDFLVYRSQIASIEETVVHGTAELWTQQLILRRYRPEDAGPLYQYLGSDPEMVRYSRWNPYATQEKAQETVQQMIDSYSDEHAYSWIMDIDGVVVGTIGAYDYRNDQIEVGYSVVRGWQGRGLATEALSRVLQYLTENEGISCVRAWCAAENTASRRVLEKSGMQFVQLEQDGIRVGDRSYDILHFEYRGKKQAAAGNG